MTKDAEIAAIKDALTTLIDACIDHRRAGSPGSQRAGTVTAADINLADSEAKEAAEAIVQDPIGESLRASVGWLGERLHEIGGLAAMQDALEAAASAKGDGQYSARVDIMDKRWNGIGASDSAAGWLA